MNIMKLPNGYGSITKLSGNRRRPWRVRKTDGWEMENGKVKQKFINIGCYETKSLALQALAKYNEDPYDVRADSITFAELFEKMSAEHFTKVSEVTAKHYGFAFDVCKKIHNLKVQDIKLTHLQKVIDESGKNTPALKKVKVLLGLMYDYAVKYEIVGKDKRDMIGYVDITKAGNPNTREVKPFNKKEVKQLWDSIDKNEYVSTVLMLIYSGLRIGELIDLKKSEVNLKERYFNVTKSKTDAGIRTVPIAKKVLPFFEWWMKKNNSEYLISSPKAKHFNYANYYNYYWKPMMEELHMEHTPHATRHTCISLMTAAKIDERFIQAIVGHEGQNVTRQVYTHFEIQELIAEIDKL
jgi:integrase